MVWRSGLVVKRIGQADDVSFFAVDQDGLGVDDGNSRGAKDIVKHEMHGEIAQLLFQSVFPFLQQRQPVESDLVEAIFALQFFVALEVRLHGDGIFQQPAYFVEDLFHACQLGDNPVDFTKFE